MGAKRVSSKVTTRYGFQYQIAGANSTAQNPNYGEWSHTITGDWLTEEEAYAQACETFQSPGVRCRVIRIETTVKEFEDVE